LSSCHICRYQIVDNNASVCPNCGAPIESKNFDTNDDTPEEASLNDTPSDYAGDTTPPVLPGHTGDDEDSIEICSPGEFIGAASSDEPDPVADDEVTAIPEANGQQSPPDQDASQELSDTGELTKLSAEQAEKIRSSLVNNTDEDIMVTPEDASSMLHKMAKITPESTSENREDFPQAEETPPIAAPAQNPQAIPEDLPETQKSPAIRHIAYFHKSFIQLTGSYLPATGDEFVVNDRHYVLKPKKFKPQYSIAAFSIIIILLLFMIGKQFISPTLPGEGSIIGILLDEDGQPFLVGAEIALPEAGKKTETDALGFFRFNDVATGSYIIRYTLPDGQIGTGNISVVNDEITTLTLDITDDAQMASSNENSNYAQPPRQQTAKPSPPATPKKSSNSDNGGSVKSSKKEYSALKLSANITDAKLTVNNEVLGVGNLTYKKLGPGKHSVKVSHDGYKTWKGPVTLRPGKTYTLKVDLEQLAQAPAKKQEPTYSAEDFYQSGKSMLADGNPASAVEDFNEAIERMPSMADAYLGRSEAYTALGNRANAESDLIRAGEIYMSQKRYETAHEMFTRVLKTNDRSIPALINRADLFERNNNHDAAEDDLKDAIKYDKDNFQANFALGKLYFAMGKNKDADKRLRKANEIKPSEPEVYHYLMLNYFARDDFNKVKKTYASFKGQVSDRQVQAFQKNPKFEPILRVVGEYDRP